MKNNVPCVMVLGTLLLVVEAKTTQTRRIYPKRRILTWLRKLCLGIATKWPIDLQDSERGPGIVRGSEMAALEKVGRVRSHETETEYTPLSGTRPVKAKVLRYELTDDGKKFYLEKKALVLIGEKESRGDIGFGQQALDSVIKIEGPITVGDKKEVTLYYTYKIENLAN
jgi:hypothetical protein